MNNWSTNEKALRFGRLLAEYSGTKLERIIHFGDYAFVETQDELNARHLSKVLGAKVENKGKTDWGYGAWFHKPK